jgi:hypothetical protein
MKKIILILAVVLIFITGCNNNMIEIEKYNELKKEADNNKSLLEDTKFKLADATNEIKDIKNIFSGFLKSQKIPVKVFKSESDKDIDKIKTAIENKNLFDKYYYNPKESVIDSITYDFDKDGTLDTVYYCLVLKTDDYLNYYIECQLSYNGESIVYNTVDEYGLGIASIGIMDINLSDSHIELFINESDNVGLGSYAVYRIIDKKLKKAGTIPDEILALSGDGKVYYWGGNLYEPSTPDDFDKNLVLSYYDFDKGEYVKTNQIVGKTFTADREMILYKNPESVEDGAPMVWEDILSKHKDNIYKVIKAGEKFTVLSIDNGIKIKTEDGQEGWTGGFHMVWN